MTCKIKQHFDCNGTGRKCDICGEASDACQCDDAMEEIDCEDCDGTGRFCVTHEAACGRMDGICDAVIPPQKAQKKKKKK